jgi:hypothetical protein
MVGVSLWGFDWRRYVSCIACSILPKNGHWFVELEKIVQGPYLTEAIAFGVAASEATKLRGQGWDSRISIFDEQGNMRTEYCLCPAFKKARGARRATPRNPPVAYVD